MTGGRPTPLPLAAYGDAMAAAADAHHDDLVTIGAHHSHDRPLDAARRRAQKAAEAPDAGAGA